jgi:putative methionine-R-sulfoxide reductase with GAF domain
VVPIFVKNRLVGEFDVESYFPNTFTATEQKFVEACADVAAKYMAKG